MRSTEILEWTKVLGSLLVSWPVVGLMVLIMFRQSLRRLLDRWLEGEGASAEFGPIKIALGTLVHDGQNAVSSLNRLNSLMAESRLLELEVTERKFGGALSEQERSRMNRHIEELRRLVGSGTKS